MSEEVNWFNYLWMCLLAFAAFMLEYFSLFVIEALFLHVDIRNYTAGQRSVHCIITACLWMAVVGAILSYTKKHYAFPAKTDKNNKIPIKDWGIACICLTGCKIITFIDWHTLKSIGEFQGKNIFQFCTQYLYYIFEIMLVLLIIIYGQKAVEVLLKRETSIPFGGILLAMTWGIFHFISRGAGLEIWNGISTILFSVLSGIMYLRLNKKYLYSFLFIAIGYLL